jgi:hypothetical protein
MSVIIVGSERNFAALRPRLFTGSVSTKVAGKVSAAIAAANPGVDLGKLVPGTVLEIPDDLPHVSVGDAVAFDPGSQQAIATVLDAGSASIAGLVAGAKAQQESDASARKPMIAALGSNAVRALRRKDPSLGPAIASAQKALAAADAADKASQAALGRAQAQWQEELTALRALVGLG